MMSISIRLPPLLPLLAALGTPVCVTADSIPTPVRTFAQAFAGGAGQGTVRATAVPDLYESGSATSSSTSRRTRSSSCMATSTKPAVNAT